MVSVSIVGVSGFSGMELVRLLAPRTDVKLVSAFSDRWQGERLGTYVECSGPVSRLEVLPMSSLDERIGDAQIVLLATPAEVSAELASKLCARGLRVLDLSGAFRLRDRAVFAKYYKFEHPAPELLAEAHFGLPQVPGAEGDGPTIREARIVSNPGCYATAAMLPLAALLDRSGAYGNVGSLIEATPLFVDGKSGVTGAGRKVAEKYLFTEVSENVSPYRVADHQHTPEIEQALSRVAGEAVAVTFAPHLLPVKRGLIATSFGRMKKGVSGADLEARLSSYFANTKSPLGDIVEVRAPEDVTIGSVVNTVRARVGVRGDDARGTFVAIAAIDNLLKGAASQALENLLRMIAPIP